MLCFPLVAAINVLCMLLHSQLLIPPLPLSPAPRSNIQQGALHAATQLPSPAAKLSLAMFLLAQVSSTKQPCLPTSCDPLSDPPAGSPTALQGAGTDSSVTAGGQGQQSLPVVLALHAATRMAVNAARGFVLPMLGVNMAAEVQKLRVSVVQARQDV